MSAKPVSIGTRIYATKTLALDAIRKVRDRIWESGAMTPEDDAFLRELIALHIDADEKVGCGIERFEVRRNAGNTLGFWIVRVDGTSTDFSFLRCLGAVTHSVRVRIAMRHSIHGDVVNFRERAFADSKTMTCPISNELVTRESCHVDHSEPKFLQLADAFAASIGGYEIIEADAFDGTFGAVFASSEVRSKWRAYHNAHAALRIVSRTANLSTLRRAIKRKDGAA